MNLMEENTGNTISCIAEEGAATTAANNLVEYSLYPSETQVLFKEFFEQDWIVSYLQDTVTTGNTAILEDKHQNEVFEFASKYCELMGITLYIPKEEHVKDMNSWAIVYSPAEKADLARFILFFVKEFGVYSKEFFKKVNMTTLVFCYEAFIDYKPKKQYRAAIPDYYEKMGMIYSVKETSIKYIKTACHHELFHYVDWNSNGTYDCPKWRKINVSDFKYGGGGHLHRKWKPLDPSIKGFVNFYSTTAIEEDKAEIYSTMVNNGHQIGQHDEIVQQKVSHMKDLILKYEMLTEEQLDLLAKYRENTDL